jgi:tryptophan-rich sensory protein
MKCSEDKNKSFKEKLSHLFNEADLLALRLVLALSSLSWAILLAMPGNTFDRPMFYVADKAMPEEIWTLLFCIHGIAAMVSLFSCKRIKILFFLDSILGSFLWTGISIGMLSSVLCEQVFHSMPDAAGSAIVLAMASWWSLIRFPSTK